MMHISGQVPPPPPIVIVISGPSGVGKDAVIKALQAARPDLHFVITATSRFGLVCAQHAATQAQVLEGLLTCEMSRQCSLVILNLLFTDG